MDALTPCARRFVERGQRLVEIVDALVEIARLEPPLDARRIDLDRQTDARHSS